MIAFPFKRVFGLIGAPRVGKDSVAQFLQESRGFKPMAFADRIKEEFGVTNEDFEAAKIAGNIEELRDKLWDFSAEKKRINPRYFIDLVTESIKETSDSVVVTDIRTQDELEAVTEVGGRIYWVRKGLESKGDGLLLGSKLFLSFLHDEAEKGNIRVIYNEVIGLYRFFQYLENYFFQEDTMDLSDSPYDKQTDEKRRTMLSYLGQFEVRSR